MGVGREKEIERERYYISREMEGFKMMKSRYETGTFEGWGNEGIGEREERRIGEEWVNHRARAVWRGEVRGWGWGGEEYVNSSAKEVWRGDEWRDEEEERNEWTAVLERCEGGQRSGSGIIWGDRCWNILYWITALYTEEREGGREKSDRKRG